MGWLGIVWMVTRISIAEVLAMTSSSASGETHQATIFFNFFYPAELWFYKTTPAHVCAMG